MKDIYDYLAKKIYTFDKLKELYNVPNNEFLKYLSLVQSIPNFWKSQLKHENSLVPIKMTLLSQLLRGKQINKFVYNLLKYEIVEENKSEQKWSNTFVNEDLNWEKITASRL